MQGLGAGQRGGNGAGSCCWPHCSLLWDLLVEPKEEFGWVCLVAPSRQLKPSGSGCEEAPASSSFLQGESISPSPCQAHFPWAVPRSLGSTEDLSPNSSPWLVGSKAW